MKSDASRVHKNTLALIDAAADILVDRHLLLSKSSGSSPWNQTRFGVRARRRSCGGTILIGNVGG